MLLKFLVTCIIVTLLVLFFRGKNKGCTSSQSNHENNIIFKRKSVALNANELQIFPLLLSVCSEYHLIPLPHYNLINLIKSPQELDSKAAEEIGRFPCDFLLIDENNGTPKTILTFSQDKTQIEKIANQFSLNYYILSPSFTYTKESLQHILYKL